ARSKAIHLPLLQRLVKGTIEWRGRIDDELHDRIPRPLEKYSPGARNILRLAAYQLLFLERVPFDRVLAESLALLSSEREGIRDEVRTVIEGLRDKSAPRKKAPTDDSAAALARFYSHPEWLIERWIHDLGPAETRKLCAANNRAWPVAIRANTLKISAHQLAKKLAQEGAMTTPSKYLSDSLVIRSLPRGARLDQLEAFRRGLFQVQDESAALVGLLVAPRPNEFVIDLCAAPGGKATHLATLMRNRGEVLALDLNPTRLRSIAQNSRRLGLSIIRTKAGDGTKFRAPRLAARVLLDAPCSGFGVLGRKTDIRWAKNPETIAELTALQGALLRNAAKLVRPGGTLVYSTCTVAREENEGVVEEFLRNHPAFTVAPPPEDLPSTLFSKEGYLRTWPHRHGIGGAFAAVLRKSPDA
ncbi:MAG: hypothetical protein RL417_1454, partial [Pseudomonadota bacterium]